MRTPLRNQNSSRSARMMNNLPAESFDSETDDTMDMSSPVAYTNSSSAAASPQTPVVIEANSRALFERIAEDLPQHLGAIIERNRSRATNAVTTASTSVARQAITAPIGQTLQDIFAIIEADGNENTSKTYRGYMQEFLEWSMAQLHFAAISRGCVMEEKVILFLHTQVVGRETRVRRRNAPVGVTQEISGQTIMQYVSAIIKLYEIQKRAGGNNNPHPRGKDLKDYLKWVRNSNHERNRRNQVDRALKTVTDGYTTQLQLKAICNEFYNSSVATGLRDRCAFLMMHFGLWRSETSRMLEFADLDLVCLQNEGPMECVALMFRTNQGKTNQVGTTTYSAAIRAKDVELCAIGSLAAWLFQRWHRNREPFPKLDENRSWYQIKVICKTAGSKSAQLPATAQSEAFRAVKTRLNLISTFILHMPRHSAAVMAELFGANVEHIRRLGLWNRQALENFYLSSIPREAVRALAGFKPSHPSFFIARAVREPPAALLALVFPDINRYLDDAFEWPDTSQTPKRFLNVVKFLRVVFLQDSVQMRRLHPDLHIWNDPLFARPEYREWEDLMLNQVEQVVEPAELRIREVMPAVIDRMDEQYQTLNTRLASIETQANLLQNIINGQQQLEARLTDVTAGAVRASMVDVFQDIVQRLGDAPVAALPGLQDIAQEANGAVAANEPPHYRMNRGIVSALDAWREFNIGIGGPSLKSLEAAWQARWRPGSEGRFFNRRKHLFFWMSEQLEAGGTEETLITLLDTWIHANEASLNQLCAHLKAGLGPNDPPSTAVNAPAEQ